MTNITQLELNTIKSFGLVKRDMGAIQAYLDTLYKEMKQLQEKNFEIERKLVKMIATKEKVVVRRAGSSAPFYLASKTGSKFHAKNCAFAKNIKPKNKQTFISKERALNQGLKGCSCVA